MYEIKIIDNGYSPRFARIEFYYNFRDLVKYHLDNVCANFIKQYLEDMVFSYCLFTQDCIRFHLNEKGNIRTNDIRWPINEVTDTEKIIKADMAIFDYLMKTFDSLRIIFLVADFISELKMDGINSILTKKIEKLEERLNSTDNTLGEQIED